MCLNTAAWIVYLALPFGIQDQQGSDLLVVAKSYETARITGQPVASWLSDDYLRVSQGGAIQGKPAEQNGRGHQDIGLRDMRDRIVREYGAAIGIVVGETGMEGAPGPVRRLFLWRKAPAGWKSLSEHTTFIEPAGWVRSHGRVPEPKPVGAVSADQQWFVDAEATLAEAEGAATFWPLMAEDAIIVDDRGRVQTKTERIESRLAPEAARLRLATATVLVFGDGARVVGQLRDVSSSARALHFTHVWVRRNGAWQIVASQASPIAVW